MNKVERKFLTCANIRGGLLLFSKQDAGQFIVECEHEGITILGIDGFTLTANSIQPRIENSIDLSGEETSINSYYKLKEFLSKQDESLFFEIVCSE